MKKGFTLIELLVVIAIIAILAGILFPVFAQAKVSAKKIVAVSNLKQQSLSYMMYAIDYDDTLPRQDGCEPYSSLNSKFHTPAYNSNPLQGCYNGGFYNRLNHFSWQKWTQPYIKNVEIYFNPLREREPNAWNNNGQLGNQYMLNMGLTGGLDITSSGAPVALRGRRNPFLGGTLTAIPRPSEALLLMEMSHFLGFLPTATDDTTISGPDITAYPMAFREYYVYKFYKTPRGVVDCYAQIPLTTIDQRKAITEGVTIAFGDGSAKFMKVGAFLAKTPRKADLGIAGSGVGAGYTYQDDCHGMSGGAGTVGIVTPRWTEPWPMWGFE
ncbi:MAG: prepilin-type N-terminal cleavage/methylation domain-containing protein [Fimbriimonadaceae bacterium]|nr:prepilin-type N-terminal cleavage/methylation domain-containing protein [Fimbriimonadaceae bacterium]